MGCPFHIQAQPRTLHFEGFYIGSEAHQVLLSVTNNIIEAHAANSINTVEAVGVEEYACNM